MEIHDAQATPFNWFGLAHGDCSGPWSAHCCPSCVEALDGTGGDQCFDLVYGYALSLKVPTIEGEPEYGLLLTCMIKKSNPLLSFFYEPVDQLVCVFPFFNSKITLSVLLKAIRSRSMSSSDICSFMKPILHFFTFYLLPMISRHCVQLGSKVIVGNISNQYCNQFNLL